MFEITSRSAGSLRSAVAFLLGDRARAGLSADNPRPRGLRRPLVPLLVAALIPVLAFGGWAAYGAAEQQREGARAAARDVVERVAERIKAEMGAQKQVAETLALSAALDRPDLAAFYAEAERVRRARPLWHTVELDDLMGVQLLNLLRPLGQPLGPTADRASFEVVVRERRSVVGSIGPVGPVSGARLVALRAPVVRAGELRSVLTVAFAPEAIGTILRGAGVPEGWIGVVVDGNGRVIARTRAEAMTVGELAGEGVRRAAARGDAGFYRGRTLEGIDVETVFRALPDVDHWAVHLGVPSEALDGPVRRGLFAVGGGLIASLALACGLAGAIARDLRRERREQERRAADALEHSEARAALAIEAAEFGTWLWSVDRERVVLSGRCVRWLSLRDADGATCSPAEFLSAVHADDRDRVRACLEEARDGSRVIDLAFRAGGDAVPPSWLRLRGRAAPPEHGFDGERAVYGIMADIGPQKRAGAERRNLMRRLAEAQERTQARIAHELHDQVGQTVTGLSLGLKRLERTLADRPGAQREIDEQIAWLRRLAGEIGRDLHRAAAELRPTALDDLGLVRALEAHAVEWGRRHGVAIDVQQTGLSDERLPAQVETVAYRVVQEALTNVVKHAGAGQVSVVLGRRASELRVLVEDDGVGFDAEAGPTSGVPRLGLSGMRERLALVDGELTIEAAPGSGTTLIARIPLAPPGDHP